MRRKVIQQGPSTLMVSLPMQWVKQNKIRKGQEIDVDITSNELLIRAHAQEKRNVTIRFGPEPYLDRLVLAKYREGYTQFTIHFENPATILNIKETMHHMVGCEIIEQSIKTCTLRVISSETDEDFPVIFRRMFHLVITAAESCEQYVATHDVNHQRVAIEVRETLTRLEQYALRLLNKQNNYSVQQKSLEFFYVWNIATFGKIWSSLAKKRLQGKLTPKEKRFIRDIVQYTHLFLETFYKRDRVRIHKLKKRLYDLRNEGDKLLSMSKDPLVIFYLLHVLNRMYEVSLTFDEREQPIQVLPI